MQEYLYNKMYEVETNHWWFQAKKNIIINLIKEKILPIYNRKIEIADLGCGVGLLLNNLSNFGNTTGIDFSKQAIDFCKESFKGDLIQADFANNLTIDKKFDLIIASDFIEHIEDDKKAINNIYKLLNNNGHAIITVPAFQFLWSQHDINHMHYRRYDIASLVNKLKSSPFKICYISYYNFFLFIPAFIIRMIKKITNFDKNSNLELTIPNNYINKFLYKIFSMESKYINRNKKFPFGLSLIAVISKS